MTRRFVNAKCPACGRLLKGWVRHLRGAAKSPRLPQHRAGEGIIRPWCQASNSTVEQAVIAGVRNV